MKAFRFYTANEHLRFEDIPIPKIGENDVLVKIMASGVCGTDVHYTKGRAMPPHIPLILGHEIAGNIEKIGTNVKDLVIGDRVLVHYVISCGRCAQCVQGNDNKCRNRISVGVHTDGGFAEYISIPARNAFKLPSIMKFEEGAITGCAVSTPFHALFTGKFKAGDSVAVFGLGGIGIHSIIWAKLLGASQIFAVDISEFKLRLAKELGADIIIDPKLEDPIKVIRDAMDGWGVDIALECAGSPITVKYTLDSVRGKNKYETGRAVFVALQPGPISVEWIREGLVTMSGDHTMEDLRRILALAARRRVDLSKTITHRIPFSRLGEGIEILENQTENAVKIVINME